MREASEGCSLPHFSKGPGDLKLEDQFLIGLVSGSVGFPYISWPTTLNKMEHEKDTVFKLTP